MRHTWPTTVRRVPTGRTRSMRLIPSIWRQEWCYLSRAKRGGKEERRDLEASEKIQGSWNEGRRLWLFKYFTSSRQRKTYSTSSSLYDHAACPIVLSHKKWQSKEYTYTKSSLVKARAGLPETKGLPYTRGASMQCLEPMKTSNYVSETVALPKIIKIYIYIYIALSESKTI